MKIKPENIQPTESERQAAVALLAERLKVFTDARGQRAEDSQTAHLVNGVKE